MISSGHSRTSVPPAMKLAQGARVHGVVFGENRIVEALGGEFDGLLQVVIQRVPGIEVDRAFLGR